MVPGYVVTSIRVVITQVSAPSLPQEGYSWVVSTVKIGLLSTMNLTSRAAQGHPVHGIKTLPFGKVDWTSDG